MAGFFVPYYFLLALAFRFFCSIIPIMAEQIVPGITFEAFQKTARRPAGMTEDRWKNGMAVTRTLLEIGKPTQVIEDGYIGPNMPVRYLVKGSAGPVVVEHATQWLYATVVNARGREHVFFYDDGKATQEEIIVNLKNVIAGKKPEEAKLSPGRGLRNFVKKFL